MFVSSIKSIGIAWPKIVPSKLRRLAVVVFLALLSQTSEASDPEFVWAYVPEIQQDFGITAMEFDSDGSILAAVSGTPRIEKLSPDGRLLQRIEPFSRSVAGNYRGIRRLRNGDFYLIGTLSTPSGAANEGFVARVNPDFNVLWLRRYGHFGSVCSHLEIDGGENLFVIGLNIGGAIFDGENLIGPPNGGSGFIASYSPEGFLRWVRMPAASFVRPTSISVTPNGDILFAASFAASEARYNGAEGAFVVTGNESWDTAFVAKLSTLGSITWMKKFSGASVVKSLEGDRFLAAGFRTQLSPDLPAQPNFLFEFENDFRWVAPVSPGAFDQIDLARSGNGASYIVGASNRSMELAAYSETGTQIWSKTITSGDFISPDLIKLKSDNILYIGGNFKGTSILGNGIAITSVWHNVFVAKARLPVPAPEIPVQVSTLAGDGEAGHRDATNPLAAKFSSPDGGAVTKDGVIFFGDAGNHVIRHILPSGEVGTWAGVPESMGYREGIGPEALFNTPLGLTLTSNGDLLVADYLSGRVRTVLGLGYRSTALLAGPGLNGPNDMVELNGDIYFTEFLNHTVRRIDAKGALSLVAGAAGTPGYRDATGGEARFNGPAGICAYNGDLFITDWNNHRIRKVTTSGTVTTIAGTGSSGFKDGLGVSAQLGAPNGIVADPAGNFYFTEFSNSAIRRLDTNGWVSVIAGTGQRGFADGDKASAKFSSPGGICIHPDGSLIITDTMNHRIRRIVLNDKTNSWSRAEGFLTVDLNPTLKIYGAPGERFRIETRPSLGRNTWMALTNIAIVQSPTFWTDPRPDPAQSRIYRAVKE